MPIEIRELIVKVRIEEEGRSALNEYSVAEIKKALFRECKKEIRSQLRKNKER